MLKRVYIDNYKCFVNFEWKPETLNLVLGANGSGKSAFFEVLTRIRSIVVGDVRVTDVFPASSLTAWDSRSVQRFEIEWASAAGALEDLYVLEVEHERETGASRIKSEKLSVGGALAYEHDGTNVTVAGDEGRPPVTFAFSPHRSYLSTVDFPSPGQPSWDGPSASFAKMQRARLFTWKLMFSALHIYKLDVRHIAGTTADVGDGLRSDGLNFASWYPHMLQERPDLMARLQQDLSGIVDELRTLRVVPSSQGVRRLVATFGAGDREKRPVTYDLPFEELSEGQRALIVLYSILRTQAGSVVCFDEPDNFVALPEIQPWLVELSNSIEAFSGQAFVISHHPEVIDYLAAGSATLFERLNGGPARARPLSVDRALGLKASEILARGWHDDA